jgi:hypothetical protein
VLPPNQRLEPTHLAITLELEDRLIEHPKLATVDRLPELLRPVIRAVPGLVF